MWRAAITKRGGRAEYIHSRCTIFLRVGGLESMLSWIVLLIARLLLVALDVVLKCTCMYYVATIPVQGLGLWTWNIDNIILQKNQHIRVHVPH